MDKLLQIATKENLRQENFRQHQNFIFFSIVPINCNFQQEYLTSCITLSDKKSLGDKKYNVGKN